MDWLVVYLPLWGIWKSNGIIVPNIWKVIKAMFQTTNQWMMTGKTHDFCPGNRGHLLGDLCILRHELLQRATNWDGWNRFFSTEKLWNIGKSIEKLWTHGKSIENRWKFGKSTENLFGKWGKFRLEIYEELADQWKIYGNMWHCSSFHMQGMESYCW